MLTADFDRLGVADGDRLLDLGCGFGRHAFEAARRGAEVVALDAGEDEIVQVRAVLAAMVEAGELERREGPGRRGAGRRAGPAVRRRGPSTASWRPRSSSTSPTTARPWPSWPGCCGPGGTMAVTVPRCGPEVVNWLLSDDYHDVPGGHIRIYRRTELARRLSSAGLRRDRGRATPTGCTPPTGGCGAWSGRTTTPTGPWRPSTASWSGTSRSARG